ncbi:MAG: hypothetical protein HMLKMBBP_01266 [Planctomycetes bacterium]|nr:hypothetical protein [Planctomycetota bacterium]
MFGSIRSFVSAWAASGLVALAVLAGAGATQPAAAQEKPEGGGAGEAPPVEMPWPPPFKGVTWTAGPAKATIGSHSELDLPEGYHFGDGDAARAILRMWGNLTGSSELGVVLPAKGHWAVFFEFEDIGYVKDDEKIDAGALMESMKENDKRANEMRRSQGLPELELVGWLVEPHYDEATKNLEWGIRLRSAEGESANYKVKLLGRHGVMNAELVCGAEEMQALLPPFRKLIAGHAFSAGNTYGEYKQGDKVAEYGLAALVAGGGLALAAKAGILQKFWKFIVAGVVALVAGVKKLFGKGGNERRGPIRS